MIFGFGKGKQQAEEEDERDFELVTFQGALNGKQPDLKANAKLAEAGLVPAKEMISDALRRRAEMVRLDPKENAAIVAISIDGVKYSGGKMPKQRGLAVTQMLKLLAGLDIKQRGQAQTGGIKAQYAEIPYELKVTSSPVPGGERLQVQIFNLKQKLDTPEQIGITPDLKEKIRELTSERRGCVLVCGAPLSGVTTTTRGVVLSIDSYLYVVYAITELTGIKLRNITNFEKNPADDYEGSIARCIRSEADCIYVDPIQDAETAQILFRKQQDVVLLAEFNASDAASGIAKLVSWVGDPAVVASGLKGIISPKLVRLLCDKCKQAFKPNPKLLEKMGLPPETKVLYRPPKADPGEGEEVVRCEACANLGFRGRAPLFEMIEMTEQMHELVAKGPQAAEIKSLAPQQKMPSLQREGLKLVAAGRTTIEELQRAFKPS